MAVFPQPMVVPRYAESTLSDVLPSVCARLGVPGTGRLELPESERYVVLLIDGLGDLLLDPDDPETPYLGELRGRGRSITSGVPSTTVTSLTCLGTGLPPGQHGMAGYMFRLESGVFNALLWNTPARADQVQSRPTWFEQAKAAGVSVTAVSPAQFEGSGLTESALRGPDFSGVVDESDQDQRIDAVVRAATVGTRSLVYAYERELDHTGHGLGVAHPSWRQQLLRIDGFCAALRQALPDEVRLVITGDHGMIDVPGRNFLIVEEEPDLLAEVTGFAGEGRLRQLYAPDPAAVARRWADRLGDHAWVRTRDEAIDEGWFGPMSDDLRDRFGDVLVAMRTDWAVMTRTLAHEMNLVGMHGSLTPVEMRVPLLVD